MYKLGSLFSGEDGIALAFLQAAGIIPRWHVEIIEWRRKLLAHRFPRSQIFEDVRNVGKENLKPVDIIVGGFPCQDISGAGLRAGLSGERSGLWYEYARIIGELRPAVVFLENADEICAPIRERGSKRITDRAPGFAVIDSLAEMGFDAQWGIVGATNSGAPHERLRWWCIAWNVSNANEIRRQRSATVQQHTHHSEQHAQAHLTGRQAVIHAPVSSAESGSLAFAHIDERPTRNPLDEQSRNSIATSTGSGVPLGDTAKVSLQAQREIRQQITPSRSSSQEFEGTDRRGGKAYDHESNMGRIVFDGLPSRLERYARTQSWAAPFGAQPYPYEPPRLTDDLYDWQARVEAIGDSVCVPVVCAFAEGAKQLLDALYGVS